MQMSEAQQDVGYISATVQKVSYKDGIFMMSLAFGVHLTDLLSSGFNQINKQSSLTKPFSASILVIGFCSQVEETDSDYIQCNYDLQATFSIVCPLAIRSRGAAIAAAVENTILDRLVWLEIRAALLKSLRGSDLGDLQFGPLVFKTLSRYLGVLER